MSKDIFCVVLVIILIAFMNKTIMFNLAMQNGTSLRMNSSNQNNGCRIYHLGRVLDALSYFTGCDKINIEGLNKLANDNIDKIIFN